MDDDDEFGDLYTDILLPSSSYTPIPTTIPSTLSRPGDTATQTLTVDPNSTSSAAAPDADDDWLLSSNPSATVDPVANWADDEEEDESPPPRVSPKQQHESFATVAAADANAARISPILAPEHETEPDPLFGAGIGDVIPGLSAGPTTSGPKAANSEDWDDSDSEDDLQIVLNDSNNKNQFDMMGGVGDEVDGDEEEEDLVIVTGEAPQVPMGAEESEWAGGEENAVGPAAEDGTEAAKAGNGAVVGTAGPARTGYSGFQHHSMYKYVRPGATALTGATAGVVPNATGQFRPPLQSGPFAGRGRGDWRAAGGRGIMNKGFHSGYGMSAWGNSAPPHGGGLGFTLPPHKTVFQVDIDIFEEKPWKYPGADLSDFFNFGLDEEKWKDYCRQLDQLRLESTMQSRIRVYESGRSEEEFDPDLPPELAAATGQETPADNRNKADYAQADFSGQGRGSANMRPPLLTGRPIQVGTGYGERLPSIDTRLPRMREMDAIIEIVPQDSVDDPTDYDEALEQPEKNFQGSGNQSVEVEEDRHFAGKTDPIRQVPFSSEGGETLDFTADSHHQYPRDYKRSPAYHRGMAQGSSRGGASGTSAENSNAVSSRQPPISKSKGNSQKERPGEGSETKDSSRVSPTTKFEAADDLSTEEDRFGDNDERLALIDSIEGEEVISDPNAFSETNDDDNLLRPGKKQKVSSRLEQSTAHDNSDQDELRTINSDYSRGKSGSSNDHPKRLELGEEVDGRSMRVNYIRRHHDGGERSSRRKDDYHRGIKADLDRDQMAARGRDDGHNPYAHREWDIARGRSYERAKEAEIWQRRGDSFHNRRAKEEEMRMELATEAAAAARHRVRVRPGERDDRGEDVRTRKRLDDGDWRGKRPREMEDLVLNRLESLDDSHIKRKKVEENMRKAKPDKEDNVHGYRARDDASRRKKERDEGTDQKRGDDGTKIKEKSAEHNRAKHKDDNLRCREGDDRQRPKQSHENKLNLHERDERRGSVRSGRVVDNKSTVGSSKKKVELKSAGLDKDYEHDQQYEPLKRDQSSEENAIPNKGRGDVHPREKLSNKGERNSRQERMNSHDSNRTSTASELHHLSRDRHKEIPRKGRGAEVNNEDTHRSAKRRRDDNEKHRNEKVDVKGNNEQESSTFPSSLSSKKSQKQISEQSQDDPFLKQGEEDPMSDDDNREDSRRGRSKLERWTSNKEIDYNSTTGTVSTSIKSEILASSADKLGKSEATNKVGNSDLKVGDNEQTADKTAEEMERHLETMERLKRRSERFKLPMPGEREVNKKAANELPPPQNEAASADMEVKPDRPPRKRRWTGS